MLPWKIQSKDKVIEANGVEFTIKDYGCLLVGELDFLKSLPADLGGNDLIRTFTSYCLRLRYDIGDDVSDEQLLQDIPIDLLAKLFNFLVYGDENKGAAEVVVSPKKPLSRTGANSSGNSSSITQEANTSLLPRPTRNAPSASSVQPSRSMKMSA